MDKGRNITSEEQSYLNILDDTLRLNDIPTGYYRINEESECSVCITKEENWVVYGFERGKRFNQTIHENVNDACLELIYNICDSTELLNKINKEYIESINNFLLDSKAKVYTKK